MAKVATVSRLHKQSITACGVEISLVQDLLFVDPLTTCLVFLLASQFMGEGFHYTVEFPHHPPLMHSLLRGLVTISVNPSTASYTGIFGSKTKVDNGSKYSK